MYIYHTNIFHIFLILVILYFETTWSMTPPRNHVPRGYSPAQFSVLSDMKLIKQNFILKFAVFFKGTENTERPRKELYLVFVLAIGFCFPFRLFKFECFIFYVWTLGFLHFGSNAIDENIVRHWNVHLAYQKFPY